MATQKCASSRSLPGIRVRDRGHSSEATDQPEDLSGYRDNARSPRAARRGPTSLLRDKETVPSGSTHWPLFKRAASGIRVGELRLHEADAEVGVNSVGVNVVWEGYGAVTLGPSERNVGNPQLLLLFLLY
jgi:hypothetical protein